MAFMNKSKVKPLYDFDTGLALIRENNNSLGRQHFPFVVETYNLVKYLT